LPGEGALTNRTRKRLYEYITKHPGVSFQILKEAFRMKDGTLRYHLQYLLSKGEIVRSGDSHRRVYYCAGVKKNSLLGRAIPGKLSQQQRRILEIIAMDPGITSSDIWLRSKQTKRELNQNLRSLTDLGLIWKVKVGGKEGYEFITHDGLYREVYMLLLDKLLKEEISIQEFDHLRGRLKKIMKE
jgi:predicted transcriptional regulator